MDLRGQVALVTGAARGLGRATAAALTQAGARVAAHQREGGEFPADLAGGPEAAESLVDAVVARFGRIDYLVNNAALTPANPLRDAPAAAAGSFQRADAEAGFDPGRFDAAIAVNLRAPLQLALAAAPHGLQAVVNVGSGSTERGDGSSAYFVVSKGAVPALTRYLARRLAPAVRVNAFMPGLFDTEQLAGRGERFRPLREEIVRRTPMARLGRPEEAAETILYLLAGNTFITGEVLCVDGGWLL